MKRALDLIVTSMGLLALLPVFACIGIAVWVSLGRPILYRQERTGRRGRRFDIIKFRTMHPAEPGKDGPEHDGERLTRVGRLLRAASLDELPTLLNVLLSDMSLVGPRPLPVRYETRYSPEQARRHTVRPGITGWAQVRGRNALTWDEKFKLDVWYVDHQSPALDLKILIQTVGAVIAGRGISQSGHATMPEFEPVRETGE